MDPLHNNRNAGNVIGGHKANISNPHTSEEAKERSRQILEQIGDETQSSKASSNAQGEPSMEGKNKGNVIGGYKATMHNPNTSDEAKERARENLEKVGVDTEDL